MNSGPEDDEVEPELPFKISVRRGDERWPNIPGERLPMYGDLSGDCEPGCTYHAPERGPTGLMVGIWPITAGEATVDLTSEDPA